MLTPRSPRLLMAVLLLSSLAGSSCSTEDTVEGEGQFQVDVWADNWFSLSLGETLVGEDSVPITTERSFNKESFRFDGTYPLVLNFTVKDYMETDSGLEYIGTDKQQLGDGGFIAQVTDTTSGAVIAVTNADWSCLVIHRAPTNIECEDSASPETECLSEITAEPSGWMGADYDFSAWPAAIEYTETEVGAKEGYTEVSWDANAKLIWSESLKQDNTLLCKLIVQGP
ncbi:MAG: PEBP family protein [Myxococcota bacterium]